ncbi:hypothetical protein BLOT_001529 [Blomia tropicalis]|nr:hypothetical protein BLOT_001529 [Blomia tropicalis]
MQAQNLIVLIVCLAAVSSEVIQTTNQSRREKMLRLCLWTHCRSASSMKKCPVSLEQSARRKCRLENGEIGFYSKCCLYENPFPMQKT